MNTSQLECFVAAAELENFTRAAKRIHVSQAAVTQQIKALEAQVGTDLFERRGRHVRLTDAGRVFLDEARSLLEASSLAIDRAQRASRGYSGSIDFSFLKGCEQLGISTAIARFRKANPGVLFSFTRRDFKQIFDSLEEGTSRFALNFPAIGKLSPDIGQLRYTAVSVYAVVDNNSPFALEQEIQWADLQDSRIIAIQTSTDSEVLSQQDLAKIGSLEHPALFMPDMESAALSASIGNGVALMPSFDLNLLDGFPTLRAVRIAESKRPVNLYWNNAAMGNIDKLFLSYLKSQIK